MNSEHEISIASEQRNEDADPDYVPHNESLNSEDSVATRAGN